MRTRFFWENEKERDHQEDLGIEDNIIIIQKLYEHTD
jgi:hypothetical protein